MIINTKNLSSWSGGLSGCCDTESTTEPKKLWRTQVKSPQLGGGGVEKELKKALRWK